ncbi:Hsp20/alpha crystallin family protein [Effusibacillus dendaii]|uniref:Hsp20/alpha crystallin family protein n=1 Tax=Effusibacillus dendaii TaxID=2743772 RepID=A0A7I8DFH5_9BACL|nr:Hsp20/alpha crystallin family protein [Effusibacillus dendaii]BCJ86661.1 hypothetical protein skT53_16460 [Effusibacillus dendaii]
MNTNPMDSLRQLGQLGEQFQKMFGEDFLKTVMGSQNGNMPNLGNLFDGNPLMPNAGFPMQNMFNGMSSGYPRVDLYQSKNELVAVIEAPGIEKSSDVKIAVESNRLHIKGNQGNRYPGVARDQFLMSERQSSFEREIQLPVRVLPNKVRAAYRQGILEVRMIKDTDQNADLKDNTIPIDFE